MDKLTDEVNKKIGRCQSSFLGVHIYVIRPDPINVMLLGPSGS